MRLLLAFNMCLFLLFTGCEPKIINDDIGHISPRVCVNGLFTADSTWQVDVTMSKSILNDSKGFDDISNAVVTVTKDDRLLTTLNFTHSQGGSFYTSEKVPSVLPEPGSYYRINIHASGFPDLNAECRLPRPVQIAHVDTLISPSQQNNNIASINVYVNDPPNEENFYQLIVRYWRSGIDVNGKSWKYNKGYPLVTTNPLYMQSSVASIDLESGNTASPILFSDAELDGKLLTIPTTVQTWKNYSEQEIVLLTLSKEYYTYLVSLWATNDIRDDPFSQPINVYSNVHDGLGIFQGMRNA